MLFVETSGYQQGRVESHQLSDHVWRLTALRRCGASREMAAVMSGNLLRLIQNLPASSSVTLTWSADSTGGVHLDLTARAVDAQFARDLEWVSGTWHIWEPVTPLPLTRPGTVYEVRPAVLQSPPSNLASLGFASLSGDDAARSTHSKSHAVSGGRLRRARGWPKPALSDATSLMEALHSMSTACESELEEMPAVRIHLAPATEFEAELAEHEFLQTEGRLTPDEADGYLGTPVRMRVLIGVSEEASLPTRLRIALGDWALGDYSTRAIDPAIAGRVWDGIDALAGHAVPEGYAAIFARLPVAGPRAKIIGMRVQPAVADVVPLSLPDDNAWNSKTPTAAGSMGGESPAVEKAGIRLGHALDERGKSVPVSVTSTDALRHLHIVGGSGTGKSTLEAALVHGIAASGHGALVLDPHGTLVQRILDELPEEAAERAVVVDSADLDNPVPINIFQCTDAETAISEMLEMLYSLFDPRRTGIIGPRFERIFRQVMTALVALYGQQAALPLVPMVLASRDRIEKLVTAITPLDPVVARALRTELVDNRGSEFSDLLAWVTSKFDRFIHTPAIRGALGTGKDAADVPSLMERNGILLVNLASPQIGQEQARLLGMMWLEKVSLAMAGRQMGADPFFVVVDEAHLFRESLLEEMLAEGRKFGISVTVAHQHFGQLSPQLLEALEGNAATVLAFRSSVDDAGRVAARLGEWPGESLSRLDNMTAAATLAVPRGQTPPFTLMVDHNETVARKAASDPETAELVRLAVEIRSQEQLVDPYREDPVLGEKELKKAIERAQFLNVIRK